MAAGGAAFPSPEAEEDRRALDRWERGESEENRGGAARRAAAEVLARFRREVLRPAAAPVPVASVYRWLGRVTEEPRWHGGRCNRLVPQRVVFALLETLGHPDHAALRTFVLRGMSGVDLQNWWHDVRAIPGRAATVGPHEDARLLWHAYRWEQAAREGGEAGAGPPKVLRERWRRWNRWLRARGVDAVPRDDPADPALPAAFTDPRFRPAVEPYIRLLAALRWGDHDRVLQLFRTLAQFTGRLATEEDARRARTLRAYARPFFHVCAALSDALAPAAGERAERPSLIPLLDGCTRSQMVAVLEAAGAAEGGPARPRLRDLGRCIKVLYQFTHGAWSNLLPAWRGWSPIHRREVGYQPAKRRRGRDRFTEEEVARLRATAARDPFDHGLLVFMLFTGCRSGASCSLLVADVVARDALRATGSVLEKGGVRREFAIDPLLGAALRGAIAVNRGSPYVFPANQGIGRRPERQNDVWLRGLCARCVPPIRGEHVHVHAIRRTTISLLLDAGNPLECVSQWIGHRSTSMTQHYWEPGPDAVARRMVLPWMQEGRPGVAADAPPAPQDGDDEDEEEDRRLDVLEALLTRARALELRVRATTSGDGGAG